MPRALGFRTDTSNVARLAGYLQQYSLTVQSDKFIGSILTDVHSAVAVAFDETMDVQAKVDPQSFHHVYEWGKLGESDGRLWRDTLTGRGKNRIASFEWQPSRVPVPASDEQKEVHVFTWKAPVMEYSNRVTVKPKLSKVLAFQTDSGMVFTTKPVHPNPGGEGSTGQFTKAYTDFFGGAEGEEIISTMAQKIGKDISPKMKLPTRKGSISIITAEAAFEEGRAAAKKFLSSRRTNYIRQAQTRRRREYGDV